MLLSVNNILTPKERGDLLWRLTRDEPRICETVSLDGREHQVLVTRDDEVDGTYSVTLRQLLVGGFLGRQVSSLTFDFFGTPCVYGRQYLERIDRCLLALSHRTVQRSQLSYPDAFGCANSPEWRKDRLRAIAEKAPGRPVELDGGTITLFPEGEDTFRILVTSQSAGYLSIDFRVSGDVVADTLRWAEFESDPHQMLPLATYQGFVPLVDTLLDEAHRSLSNY